MPLWQKAVGLGSTALIAGGAWLSPVETAAVLLAAFTVPFAAAVGLRIAILWNFAVQPAKAVLPVDVMTEAAMPVYSLLIPLYREACVVPDLMTALRRLDYPPHKLEILFLLESNDPETRDALAAKPLDPFMRVLVVPDGRPRTKPRALNYGLAHLRGDYVVVYDAEDAPEADQLRRALAAFRAGGPNLGCVQARLAIRNGRENWLTRQFAIEYATLFGAILPALERWGLPIPLGGTSNHFPRHVLQQAGGWDAFNVTEDADLGLRLTRQGWRIGILSSLTSEEAPPTFPIWLGQRTRWLKGWMQTYLVHMRRPVRLLQELGLIRFLAFNILAGGLIVSAFVHPWFYVWTACEMMGVTKTTLPQTGLARGVHLVSLFNLIAGYSAVVTLSAVVVMRRGSFALACHALVVPVYWLLISFAAYRAFFQLMKAPFHWEKTPHRPHSLGVGEPFKNDT